MRIKKVLLLVSLLIISICYSVKADGFSYYLSRKDLDNEYVDKNNIQMVNVQKGDYIYVTSIIKNTGMNNYKIGKGKLTLRWDSSYVDLIDTNSTNGTFNDLTYTLVNRSSNKLTIEEFTTNSFINVGKNILFEFKFQVLYNAKTSPFKIYQMDGEDSINCIDSNDNSTKCAESLYTELKYNVMKSTTNKLLAIKLDDNDLEFFDENVVNYDIEVDPEVTSINISAIKKDPNSVIGGDIGNKKLDYGINTFTINVISESGDVNTYTLNITRIDERSTINTLKTVTISDINFTFKSNVTEYDLDVSNDIDEVIIDSTLTDAKSIYVKGYGNRGVKLNEGSNKVLIKVLSESGVEKTYTFNITRALSGNNTLKSLTINDEIINLKENEFIYHHTVETEVDSVIIKAIPNDNKANVNIKDKYDLQIGDNEINIVIIAPDGSRAAYIININRKKVLSNNSKLTNIKIVGYQFDFKPEEKLYYLKVKDEVEQLDIYTVPEDPFATIKIEGNENLIDGSIIKVNVKAEDGTYTRYFINIEKSRKNTQLPIIITIIVLLGLLTLCIMTIIKRKKREEKRKELEKTMDVTVDSEALGSDININVDDYDLEEKPEKENEEEINIEEKDI